ncbi:hypothetical protein K4K59_009211 [Colletotrichum sp. SAR11_240]|nr:hypothetical protein K4K59_009211 [Colletotrichum sp. SAR11_240]
MNRDKITDKHLAAAASIQPDYWFYMPDEEDWPKKWEEDDGTCLKRILGNYSWKKVVAHFETTEILAHIKPAENVPGGEQESEVNELPVDWEPSGPASEDVEAADRGNQNMTVTGSPDNTNTSGDDDGRENRIHGGRSDIEYPAMRTATDVPENREHPSKNPRTRRRFMRWWSSLTKERRSHILQDLRGVAGEGGGQDPSGQAAVDLQRLACKTWESNSDDEEAAWAWDDRDREAVNVCGLRPLAVSRSKQQAASQRIHRGNAPQTRGHEHKTVVGLGKIAGMFTLPGSEA